LYKDYARNGVDDQERNLSFVKTDFKVLKLKFHACIMKQAFYPLQKLNICASLAITKYSYASFFFELTCKCKRSINLGCL